MNDDILDVIRNSGFGRKALDGNLIGKGNLPPTSILIPHGPDGLRKTSFQMSTAALLRCAL